MQQKYTWKNLDKVNSSFLIFSPLAAVLLLIYHFFNESHSWHFLWMLFIGYWLTGLAITAGYHRLFSHRSYKTTKWVKVLYLVFGASAFQNSALKWSADHRVHHNKIDTEEDPYNINEGFFWAHMGWIMSKKRKVVSDGPLENFPDDLLNDSLIMWQHRNYLSIGILVGFVIPLLLGLLLKAPIGGVAILGFTRIVLVHHCTWFINSLCHFMGKRTFTDENTARDNFFVAFFTFGEGYHNFHHKFQSDYRNGIKWYHWDPSKWLIKTMEKCGWAKNLNQVSDLAILRAKLLMEQKKLPENQFLQLEGLRLKVEEAHKRFNELKKEYKLVKKNFKKTQQLKFIQLKRNVKLSKVEFKMLKAQWLLYLRYC